MNRYSRIFHHITVEDVKRNTQQDIELKKIKEENMIKKEIYVENGMFYITKKTALLNSKLRYSGKIGIVDIPQIDSFQIDTLNDLELIKKIL